MRTTDRARPRARAALLAVAVVAAVSGCASSAASTGSANGPVSLRLGYFATLTHASAIVGLQDGFFARALGPRVHLSTTVFAAGPAAVEALFSSAVDAAFVGPNPAINAYVRSGGQAVRLVSGAASGGAELVVRGSITSVAQLRGKTIASPQLGNTQDVALRYWLSRQGLRTDTSGGGDVSIVPQDNSQTVQTFKTGQIDGAWVPEPYASRMVLGGHGHVLVDEGSLWPGGRFATTELVVRTTYLHAHPDVVQALLRGLVQATDYVTTRPAAARAAVNGALAALTGHALTPAVLALAWSHLTFTVDPLAGTLEADAAHERAVGLLPGSGLSGLFDLSLLDAVLRSLGRPAVAQP